jgi:hypothetical protein
MDFLGLVGTYPNQRPLTDLERSRWLDQKRRLNVEPHYQLSVIRMNSKYLESVDKWYAWKGVLTAVGSAIASIFFYGIFAVGFASDGIAWNEMTGDAQFEQVLFSSVIALLSLPLIWLGVWLVKKESFAYTHYPIRFDRQSKMVHIFRTDGATSSAPWDQVFFTLGHLAQWNEWEIRGHILDSDQVTVRETFVLSYVGSLSAADAAIGTTKYSSQDFVRGHWEFVRRFMEDGPESVSSQVQFCMPVDGRRESIRVSIERVFANFSNAPILFYWIIFPFCLIISMFRVIAMRTSKIPQWPEDVEKCCVVEPGDPYAVAGAINGERIAVFPEAAAAAGVSYCAPPRDQRQANGTLGKRQP